MSSETLFQGLSTQDECSRGWSEEPRLQLKTTYSYPCLATELEGKESFKSRACVKQQQPLEQDGNSPYI